MKDGAQIHLYGSLVSKAQILKDQDCLITQNPGFTWLKIKFNPVTWPYRSLSTIDEKTEWDAFKTYSW